MTCIQADEMHRKFWTELAIIPEFFSSQIPPDRDAGKKSTDIP